MTRPVLFFYFLCGFFVSFCLVIGLVLPLVHRDNFQDLIDRTGSSQKETVVVKDQPVEPSVVVDRGQNWNRVRNPDGSYTLSSHIGAINYMNKSSNVYEPINTSIVDKSVSISGRDYSYGVDRGIYEGYFRSQSSDVSDRPMAMVKDGYTITLSPVDYILLSPHKYTVQGRVGNRIQSDAVVSDNSVVYPNQYKEIGSSDGFANLSYQYLNSRIKEEYIIWDKTYLQDRFDSQCNDEDYDNVNLTFDSIVRCYDTQDWDNQTLGIVYGSSRTSFKEYGLSGNGEFTTDEYVEFTDESDVVVFFIPRLYAFDSDGNELLLNKTVSMTSFGNLRISILVPYSWLNETAVFPVVVDPTISSNVGATNDDADEANDGTVVLDGAYIEAYQDSTVGVRWSGFNIPDGCIINSCVWEGTTYGGEDDPAGNDIWFEEKINPVTFSTDDYDITSRDDTSTKIDWSGYNVGSAFTTPDLSDALQEVIDDTSGDLTSIVMFVGDGDSTWNIQFDAYDEIGWEYSYLNITYILPIDITNPSPSDGSIYNDILSDVCVDVNNSLGYTMNISWYWSSDNTTFNKFGTNSSVGNGTYCMSNSNFTGYATTYWWNVSVDDGTSTNNSDIFSFTTTPYKNESDYWNDSFDNSGSYVSSSNNMNISGNGYVNTTSVDLAYVSNSSAIEDPSNDVEITKPDDVQNDDVLFVYLFHDNNDAGDEFNTLSGWTQIFNLTDDPSGRGGTTWCGYKVITDSGSEPASYTFTHTDVTAEDTGGIMVCLRGVDTSDVLANGTGYSYLFDDNNGDYMSPSITTDEDDALVLCMGSMSHSMSSCIAPAGTNLITWEDHDYCNIMMAYFTQESAGATGDKQWDTDGTQEARGLQIAFKSGSSVEANITSVSITKEADTTWDKLYVDVNNTDNSTFTIQQWNETPISDDVTFNVGESHDDGYKEWHEASNFYDEADYLIIGRPNYVTRAWIRYPSVSLNGTSITIDSSNIYWKAYSASSDDIGYEIYADNRSSSPILTSHSDVDSVSETSNVTWDFTTNTVQNSWYETSDISSVIQELVDNYDYSSENVMQILFKDYSTSYGDYQYMCSYDDGYAPILNISYTYSGYWQTVYTGLTGNGDDISGIANDTIRIIGEFNASVSMSSWNVTWSAEAGEEIIWNTVTSTINGSYSNTTSWQTVDNTINGSYSNITSWISIISTVNGSYSNTTSWDGVISTINGSYSNTSLITWYTVIDTINGTYGNITSWNTVINTINGSWSNTTDWYAVIDTINGTYSNTTSWINIVSTINGSYSNGTGWTSVISTINGTYSNTTSWTTIIDTINGSYSNTTSWQTVIDTINGSYSNSTSWTNVITTINGSYTNTTSWTTIISTVNGTYSNTSLPDSTKPNITINFAGNLSDSGGPYWRPPGESTQLSGIWSDGYYTNNSYQHEDWIYINITVTDDVEVDKVWLNWLNGTTWTNYTYQFVNSGGDYYEYNTSGNIQTYEDYKYSFDIVANDTSSNSNITWWNKTGVDSQIVRRYVHLNCIKQSIEYIPLYLYEAEYTTSDEMLEDRLEKDQGADGTIYDTGYMNNTIPSDTISHRNCSTFVGYWFNNNSCIDSFTLDTIYYHFWWSSTSSSVGMNYVAWTKSRDHANDPYFLDSDYVYSTNESKAKSNITWDNGDVAHSNDYHLESHLYDAPNTSFTDNDIYEFSILMSAWWVSNYYPSVISNRSFTSFVLFNIPDNTTLKGYDTDSDSLNDYEELFITYTNPFVSDTDNDGVNDYDENITGSDPNNYTDMIAPSLSWNTVIDTVNGSYSNTTIWTSVITTINGSYTNTTSWDTVIDTINGSYSNSTSWTSIIDTINGSYSNGTGWSDVISTINGSYINTTLWVVESDTINGSYSNGTSWTGVIDSINGSYSNTTSWSTVIDTVNGSWSNSSTKIWQSVISTINGSYTNTTSWDTVIDTINGSYSNSTRWSTVIDTVNGSYSNGTVWTDIISTINGSYSNGTSWTTDIDTINGTYSNTTFYHTFNHTINGTYSNTTLWIVESDTINGSYSNNTYWTNIIDSINGSYSNSTGWSDVISTINGSYSNNTLWNIINNTINGSYSNNTRWIIILDTINGTYSNTTDWYTIDNTINGTYTNDTILWNIINNTINGSYINSTGWTDVISTINGTYSNTSITFILLTQPYPSNQSNGVDENITLHITVNHTGGHMMNISWYYGNSTINATHYLGSHNNTYNNTFYMAFPTSDNTGTTYYWRVNATDSSGNYTIGVYHFTTGLFAVFVNPYTFNYLPLLALAIIPFIFLFIKSRKKQKKIRRYR